VNANCKCGKILRPGYIRCWRCELTAERSAPEVAEDSSVTAAEQAARKALVEALLICIRYADSSADTEQAHAALALAAKLP